jgi:hypothetical protein
MQRVEANLLKNPKVKHVSVTMGSSPLRYYLASTSVGPKPNFANLLIELHDSDDTQETEANFEKYMMENYPNIIIRSTLFNVARNGCHH